MDSWVNRRSFPIVTVERVNTTFFRLRQESFLAAKSAIQQNKDEKRSFSTPGMTEDETTRTTSPQNTTLDNSGQTLPGSSPSNTTVLKNATYSNGQTLSNETLEMLLLNAAVLKNTTMNSIDSENVTSPTPMLLPASNNTEPMVTVETKRNNGSNGSDDTLWSIPFTYVTNVNSQEKLLWFDQKGMYVAQSPVIDFGFNLKRKKKRS